MHTAIDATPLPTGTALLVDRDDDTRRSYADHLKQSAWATEEAADGREALAKALARRPDVIVTETNLPGISGYDLCSILKRDLATREVPVVMVTGGDDGAGIDMQRAKTAGADAVLIKPCLPDVLQVEIHRVLACSRDLRSRAMVTREKLHEQLARSEKLLTRSRENVRTALSHAYDRHDTTTPPVSPPVLICPRCDQPLMYQRSHIGGVSARHAEQWDYFECAGGCGTFQFRERTRKLKRVL
jgi:CheY-like chemotaxis protein